MLLSTSLVDLGIHLPDNLVQVFSVIKITFLMLPLYSLERKKNSTYRAALVMRTEKSHEV